MSRTNQGSKKNPKHMKAAVGCSVSTLHQGELWERNFAKVILQSLSSCLSWRPSPSVQLGQFEKKKNQQHKKQAIGKVFHV